MKRERCVLVSVILTEEIRNLIDRAIAGGRYGGVSGYVRALIVRERRRSGDRAALGVESKLRRGRPRAA